MARSLSIVLVAAAALGHPSEGRGDAPGVVKGTVIFEGEPPERPKLRRDTDPQCAKTEALSEDVIVTNGKLKDVLVRIKNGSLPAPDVIPAPALIDQRACTYTPRVVGLVTGQKLVVRNSDPTFHNVRGAVAGTQTWNKPSLPNAADLTLDGSTRAGDVIDVVCDVHPWMHAYAVVQDHAAFAVTDAQGAFTLPQIRPGSYTLEAWHPKLGTKTLEIKIGVGAKRHVTARFSYNPGDLK